jgi:hypothetical protein
MSSNKLLPLTTYASRNGVPLEIVSKVMLRHPDLKTTQVYLGKVSEHEAIGRIIVRIINP